MISARMRPRALALAMLAGVGGGAIRAAHAQQSTPAGSGATPPAGTPAATPAAGTGPVQVDGRYQLPDDPDAAVIEIHFGNFALPPEYQYGYEVTIVASGQASATIWPEGSRAEPGSDEVVTHEAELSVDQLQALIGDLDSSGFFALPQAGDPGDMPVGGEVDTITVTLDDGEWNVVAFGLETDQERETFATAHEIVLDAVGVEDLPDF